LNDAAESPHSAPAVSFARLVTYFLRLGATGFGGPVALANYMRRDLVEARGWITEAEYDSGLAIAAACPGPLAYQLGVYCGYVRFGILGGLSVAVSFGLSPFLLVVAVAIAYTRNAENWQLRALFYGVGPVVVALILKACWNLGMKTLRRDVPAWVLALAACGVTVIVQKELAILFVVAGIIGVFVFASPGNAPTTSPAAPAGSSPRGGATALAFAPPGAIAGGMVWKLFLFFFKTASPAPLRRRSGSSLQRSCSRSWRRPSCCDTDAIRACAGSSGVSR
jgi:chromate transporter